jgi:hypothetical protein
VRRSSVGGRILFVAGLLTAAACSEPVEPSGTESWAADLIQRRQVLFIQFTKNGSQLAGTGSLSDLDGPAAEPLTLTGTRTGDTLDLTLQREVQPSLHFRGWYTSLVTLSGVLDGAEFDQMNVVFKNR